MPVAKVEHEVTDQVQEGHFVIRIKAKAFDEEHPDEYDNQPLKTGVCTWQPASGKYTCDPDVLDF
jgi:hypothetical protein